MLKMEHVECSASFWKNKGVDFPLCHLNNSAEYYNLRSKVLETLADFVGNSEKHGCPIDCDETYYNPTLHYNDALFADKELTDFVLRPYYSTFYVEKKEEYFTYDIPSLISDVGGNLGLFLGYSLLSLLLMCNK